MEFSTLQVSFHSEKSYVPKLSFCLLQDVLFVVVLHVKLVSNPEEAVLVGGLWGPRNTEGISDGWGGHAERGRH